MDRVREWMPIVCNAWTRGHRHYLALGFAGVCRRAEVPLDECKRMIMEICQASGDREISDRMNTIETTYAMPVEAVGGASILRRITGTII
jgi:hypothetical protein